MAENTAAALLPRNSLIEWIIPVAAVGMVFVMLVPMPSLLLDLLLATSITASVLVLLSALHILRPVQFSVFPSLLLLLTLFRLSLNLASSRRILLHGNEGAGAAGHVIEAFGQFVVGGNYVVGFVLFRGPDRHPVHRGQPRRGAHRGGHRALYPRCFARQADGHRCRSERRHRSTSLRLAPGASRSAREAEFYGAMDGAARFNQRDALATILITAINIVAGFLIGVFQLDIPFREALKTYTVLTVGDGLVTMIPSLLVSMAGGMVVTRASSDTSLVERSGAAAACPPAAVDWLAGVMLALAPFPGCPSFPFCCLRLSSGLLAWRTPEASGHAMLRALPTPKRQKPPAEALEDLLKLDELSLEVGYGLVPLVDASRADNCWRGCGRCATTWHCNWDSSCLRCISPTTPGSRRAST